MNRTDPKTLTYFTQNEEERREKNVIAISDIDHIQQTLGVIVIGCREDMHDAILETLMMGHSPHLAGKTILVVEAGQRTGSIEELVIAEHYKTMQRIEDMTMIIQSYREDCIDVLLEKPKHSYQKQTHYYPVGKPQKSKAAHMRHPGTRNK